MARGEADQRVGQPCECGRGPKIVYGWGCAECQAMPFWWEPEHNPPAEFVQRDFSRGEIRRFLERPLLLSGLGMME